MVCGVRRREWNLAARFDLCDADGVVGLGAGVETLPLGRCVSSCGSVRLLRPSWVTHRPTVHLNLQRRYAARGLYGNVRTMLDQTRPESEAASPPRFERIAAVHQRVR
jgi:hypothetical protein